jgi:arylsulfatase A-like enzyme
MSTGTETGRGSPFRHQFVRHLWVVTLIAAGSHAGAAAKPPNIVVIVGDDMGYADVGFHGCRDIPTPHLDALAASGVVCSSGYVSGPYCSPTRAGLLTGRYQQRFGHEFNSGGPGGGLPVGETTLPSRLQKAGFATAAIGKWHLGQKPEFHPLARGFDEFFGFLGGNHRYLCSPEKANKLLRGRDPVDEPDYLTDAFGREACRFVDRAGDRPFFLYLAFNAVHAPLEADKPRLERFATITDPVRRTYAAMMTALDDNVGLVMAKLRTRGIERETLVFFFSDNGGPTMPRTTLNGSSNLPLRGSKRQTLEGGVRVPFVVSWAGTIPPGRFEQPVIQLDVTPTVLVAAGIDVPENAFDGVDLLPFLTGAKQGVPHETLHWRFGAQMAIRRGDWKLVRYGADETIFSQERWPKLYRLSDDIGESRDLSATEPDKVAELEAAWAAWNAELPPPLGKSGQQPE